MAIQFNTSKQATANFLKCGHAKTHGASSKLSNTRCITPSSWFFIKHAVCILSLPFFAHSRFLEIPESHVASARWRCVCYQEGAFLQNALSSPTRTSICKCESSMSCIQKYWVGTVETRTRGINLENIIKAHHFLTTLWWNEQFGNVIRRDIQIKCWF